MRLLHCAGLSDKRTTMIFFIVLLLLATLLRLHALDAKNLWNDEIATLAHAIVGDVGDVLSSVLDKQLPAPPLHFLLIHYFILVSDSDFFLRFLSVAFGIVAIAAAYSLGTRLFGRQTGFLSALLLAISPFHIRYSQEARCYTLLALLSMLSLYCLWRAVLGGELRSWPGFVAFTTLNLYTHLFALLVVLAEVVFVGGLWLCAAFPRKGPPQSGRVVLRFVASLLVIAVLYAPMMPYLFQGLSRQVAPAAMGSRMDVTPRFFVEILGSWGSGGGFGLLAFLALFLLGMVVSARSHSNQLWLAFCWLVVPFVILFAVPARHGFRPRYVLFMLPLYLLFVARGLSAASEVINVWLQKGRPRLRGASLTLLLLTIAFLSVPAVRAYYDEDRANWRAAAALLARGISPGDVIVSPGPLPQVVLPRYEQALGGAVFLIGGSEKFLTPEREQQGGVWFVGLQEERMAVIESEVKEAVSCHFRVVLEVDDQNVARSGALEIAPVMYKDLWVTYVRVGLGPEEVIQLYEEALDVVPSSAASSIHVGLGDRFRAEGELEQALVHYQEAVVLDPSAPEPHYGLARVHEAQGLWNQSVREWQKYDELVGEGE